MEFNFKMKNKVFERPEKKVFERSALVLVCLQGKLPGALGETFEKSVPLILTCNIINL